MDPLKKRKLEENGVVLPDLTIEDARKILEPLTHEQLFEIVQNALLRHPDVLDAVRSVADRDITQRKLFIRGLGWETTTEKLRVLFSQYGELEEAVVILDKATGKSKGYGFVTFKHIDGAFRALKQPSKQIDGRMAVTQLASAGVSGGGPGGGAGGGGNSVDVSLRKIYVANVPYEMPGERLLQHFSMYGEIEEGPLGFDKATGKSKGFALFVYKTPEAARASLVDPIKNIDGHQLNCKLANEGKKGKPVVGGPGGFQEGTTNGPGNGVASGVAVGAQYGGPGGVFGMSGYTGYSGVNSVGGNPLSSTMGSGAAAAAAGAVGVGGMVSALGGSGGFSSGLGGHYGGASNFGGPGSTGYGGLSGAGAGAGGSVLGGTGAGPGGAVGGLGSGLGGAGGGLGGPGSGTGGASAGLGGAGSGLGGAGGGLSRIGVGLGGGRGSSLYGVGPGPAGMPSGEYPQGAHYNLSASSVYQNQHHPATGTSSALRVPPGGLYQGMPRYY